MFSVIIPLYNKSAFIEKCLQSVLGQTCQDFELIVINDGSTDNSREKVKKIIGNSKRSLVIDQVNMGVSTARNQGVTAAKYSFIAFLDADDWWEPAFLEEMKRLIHEYPTAGIYGSGYYTVKNSRKSIEPVGVDPSFMKGVINYFQVYAKTLSMPLTSNSVVIRKSIFESENGFNPELKLGEDFDLWVRVALKYPVAFLNIPLANYNQDVDIVSRAVGNLQKPESHVLWNLMYLADEELNKPDLKQLLDKLRVYALFPYFLNSEYHELVRKELEKIDWEKQPLSAKLRYITPVLILKGWFWLMFLGSWLKQNYLKLITKYSIQ